ncbi:acid protease [Aspergillus ellipticus CBS 707.79]|uniref:Probable aspartic-type endopeptidase OPSB n=1 Tax=Aspergillus ellipticus CBS 707.79 TaxID=1448320 RepID=A0A319E5N1_9EURO|nr:acid protease [Aspergillus ellipticus CBS 707.79]
MWGLCSLIVALSLMSQETARALTLRERDSPAIVALDIKRKDILDPIERDRLRRKRDTTTIDQAIDNEETLYFCNITLGTPGQSLRLVLDTGSSDLWCNAANSTFCSSSTDPCRISGSYNPNNSSTYAYVSSDFNISYADGTGAAGAYATDSLHIGGASLNDFQFGIGYSSSSSEGVLGIGYTSNEVQVGRFNKGAYANLPRAMVEGNLIKSNAYSLWLNDLDANTGSILFGGVNTKKYHGELQTLPIQKVDGIYSEFIIALTGVTLSSSSKTRTYSSDVLPAAVLLDSGSSLTYLPDSIVEDIYKDLDVLYEQSSRVGYVPCTLGQNDTNITYMFSSPAITVAVNELVLNVGDLLFKNGERACIFGIVPAGDSTAVLGDTFLRSAYVVYDLANNEISLANTNFDNTGDNILEIGTGEDSVPGATKVAHPVTTVAADGSGARIGGPSGPIFTEAPSATGRSIAPVRLKNAPKNLVFGAAVIGYILAFYL